MNLGPANVKPLCGREEDLNPGPDTGSPPKP